MTNDTSYPMSPFNRAFSAWLERNKVAPGTLARLAGFEHNTVKHLMNGKSQYPVSKTINRLVAAAILIKPALPEIEIEKLQRAFGQGLEDQEVVDFQLIFQEVKTSRKDQKEGFEMLRQEISKGNDALLSRLDALIGVLNPASAAVVSTAQKRRAAKA